MLLIPIVIVAGEAGDASKGLISAAVAQVGLRCRALIVRPVPDRVGSANVGSEVVGQPGIERHLVAVEQTGADNIRHTARAADRRNRAGGPSRRTGGGHPSDRLTVATQ